MPFISSATALDIGAPISSTATSANIEISADVQFFLLPKAKLDMK